MAEVSRRRMAAAAVVCGVAGLVGCSRGEPLVTVETTWDPEMLEPPETAEEVLELAEMVPAPEGVEVELRDSPRLSEFDLWAVEVALAGDAGTLDGWLVESIDEEGGAYPNSDPSDNIREAFDVGDLPEGWRTQEVSLIGSPYVRMLLVDDQDPQTVRLRLSEVRD